ncbi:LysR family transcriptional regulator [Corynebacterium sp.]|uniref:LysR family transcriptional regulator n=1 Tax=Corynebacterium sp. TaxID=1720 RepID=UPI0028AAFB21|nr:LysR family transcriptional regulator [Corynebacterium sp.]
MSPTVSWDGLRVFVTVLRAGSFSVAADELGLAQSSVSDQVARLEKNLGYKLLDRGPTGVRPTDRGAELASRVSSSVDALSAATAPDDSARGGSRIVFLGGPAEFLSEVILPGLSQRLPATTRIVSRFGVPESLLDDLRHGSIDVLVSTLPARGPDLSSAPIYDEEFVLVAHPGWARQASTDLDAVPVLSYGAELPIIRRYWRSVFDRRPDRLDVRVTAPDLRTLLRLAIEGAGMTVLPEYLLSEHLASGALVRLHTPAVPPLNTLYVATRRVRGVQDPAIRSMRDAIAEVATAATR